MKTKIFFISMGMFICMQLDAFAQHDSGEYAKVYTSLEVGRANRNRGFAQMGVSGQFKHDYLKIKFSAAMDLSSGQNEIYFDNDKRTPGTFDIGLLYGKSYRLFGKDQIQFGTGVAFTLDVAKNEEFNNEKNLYLVDGYVEQRTIGLPLEIRYNLTIKKMPTIAFAAHANVNGVKSYTGVSAGILFGRL